MKPAPFRYFVPETVEEVLHLLAEYGDEAKLLAGGQSLIPTMNFRLAQPEVLVDMNRVSGLDAIERTETGVRIGAMVRQRAAERSELIAQTTGLVTQALPWVAHAQIRNRGTMGGNLAHADPRSELPAVMLALGAVFVVRGAQGERLVPAHEFFRGLFTTAVAEGEVLVAVEVPADPTNTGSAFLELTRRNGDYALMGVACRVGLVGGVLRDARIAFLSAGDRPIRARAAMDLLEGEAPSDALFAAAAEAARAAVDPIEDVHASVEYRRHLAGVLTTRVLREVTA